MDSKYRFLLAGNRGYCNRGCEAIVRGAVRILSEKLDGPTEFVLCSFGREAVRDVDSERDSRIIHSPARTPLYLRPSWIIWNGLRVFSQRLASMYRFGNIKRFLPTTACAMQIGGDNYTADYGRLWKFTDIDDEVIRAGVPLVLFGCSVGPFGARPKVEHEMRSHLRRFSLILARESVSVRYLASLGVEDNVRRVADPAFAMAPEEPTLSDELRKFLDDRPVGLNLSHLIGRFSGRTPSECHEFCVSCVRSLLDSGIGRLLFIPHVTPPSWPLNNDHVLLKSVKDSLSEYDDRIALLPDSLSAAETKWVIGRCQVFGGARTHATIAATSAGVPTLMLGYSQKAKGLATDLYGTLDWHLPIADMTPASLAAKVNQLMSEQDVVRATLQETVPRQVDLAFKGGEYVAELLGGGTDRRSGQEPRGRT
jgi:colanic acid/amylovoran biosynthesis protein WcaK/AmsJ